MKCAEIENYFRLRGVCWSRIMVGMIRAVLTLLLASCLCLYIRGDGVLELNPLAKHVKDVNIIMHVEVDRKLIIDMNFNRTCKEPIFKVRLSGVSIHILERVTDDHANTTGTYNYFYPALQDAGTYYIEVLLLACEFVKPNNFASQCLEDPHGGKNILTLPYSFAVSADQISDNSRPRWVLEPNNQPAMLSTRYQATSCLPACNFDARDVKQYNSYSWVGEPSYTDLLTEALSMGEGALSNPTGQEVITVCMVGASHARHLTDQGILLKIPRVNFLYIDSRFPFQFDAEHYLPGCSYAIIGYGQWPLSWVMAKIFNTYTAQMYETEMREVFNRLKLAQQPTQAFVRSMNYNGMASWITLCPPTDHRNPLLVDMYNSILRNLSAESSSVPYIDTTHIQSPMWDGGLDFHHPNAKVFTAEIEHILYEALFYSVKHKHPPALFSSDAQRGQRNVLVRFSDSEVLYLFVGGFMRAFPNGQLFTTLGYRSHDNILVLGAGERAKYKFGPDLHLVKGNW